MPKSKTEMMKALRQQRKDAGLVELRLWVTKKQYGKLKLYWMELQSGYKR